MKKICLSILLALSVTHISTAQIGNLKNKLKEISIKISLAQLD